MRPPRNPFRTVLDRWRRYVVFDVEQNAISTYRLSELDDWRAYQKVRFIIGSMAKRVLFKNTSEADLWLAPLPVTQDHVHRHEDGTTAPVYTIWESLDDVPWEGFDRRPVYRLPHPKISSKYRSVEQQLKPGRVVIYVGRNPPAKDAHQWTVVSKEPRPVPPNLKQVPLKSEKPLKLAEGRMPLTSGHRRRTVELAYGVFGDASAHSVKQRALTRSRISGLSIKNPNARRDRKITRTPTSLRRSKTFAHWGPSASAMRSTKPETSGSIFESPKFSNHSWSTASTTPVDRNASTTTVNISVPIVPMKENGTSIILGNDDAPKAMPQSSLPIKPANETRLGLPVGDTEPMCSNGGGPSQQSTATELSRRSHGADGDNSGTIEAVAKTTIEGDKRTSEDAGESIEDRHPIAAEALSRFFDARSRLHGHTSYLPTNEDQNLIECAIKSAIEETGKEEDGASQISLNRPGSSHVEVIG